MTFELSTFESTTKVYQRYLLRTNFYLFCGSVSFVSFNRFSSLHLSGPTNSSHRHNQEEEEDAMVTSRKSSRRKSERNYDEENYWNDRYRTQLKRKSQKNDDDDHTDEWYFSYSDISDVLKSYLKQIHRNSPILDIGCGLSKIFDELSNDRFNGPFVGVDYSSVVIDRCKKSKKTNRHYLTLNMMDKSAPHLPFDSFGLIIDKGTTDGILCNRTHLKTISNLYENASRLLASNGLFVLITIKTIDDEEWFEQCLIPSLIRGRSNNETKFIIHFHRCVSYTDGSENGPNIFVIVKYDCKSYPLRSIRSRSKDDFSQMISVKCY